MTSLRQLARIIGCDEKAVRKAEKAGVFGSALRRGDDGEVLFLDLPGCIDRWEKSGRRLRGSTPARASAAPAAGSPSVPPPAAIVPAPASAADDGFADVPEADDDAAPPAPATPSLVEAQRMAMLERHRMLKLRNDEREGSLVAADRASREAFEFSRVVRENVLNVPGRIGAELAAETDAGRVVLLLENALREALEGTANTIDAATSPAPATSTPAA